MKLRFWRRKKKIPIIKTKPLIYGNINYGTSGATDLIVKDDILTKTDDIFRIERDPQAQEKWDRHKPKLIIYDDVITEPIATADEINEPILGDLSMADNITDLDKILLRDQDTLASDEMESMDLVHKDLINEPILTGTDDIFGIPKEWNDLDKENQCLGTAKKTGKPCERTTPLGYCWQHQDQANGDE